MKTTEQIKRDNLKFVIDKYHNGVTRQLEVALEKNDGALSRYFSDSDSGRSIGPTFCTQVEELHNLGAGWMITDHSTGETDTMSAEELMLLELYRQASDNKKKDIVKALQRED
jgi:hypothetical protein